MRAEAATAVVVVGLTAGLVAHQPAKPGDWTVRFTAVKPAATLDLPQGIAPPPTSTTTTRATTTTEATTTAVTEPDPDDVAAPNESAGNDDGSAWVPA
jgi:hypothetical protein